MTKANKYILLTAGLLIISLISFAKKKSSAMFSNFAPSIQTKLNIIASGLSQYNLPEEKLRWIIAQVLFETGLFTKKSSVAVANNNYSGIKWINASRQKNASRGSEVPASERVSPATSPINFYAKFNSFEDWSRDHYRIISTFGQKPILTATTLKDYISKLKKNSYFGSSEEDYYNGVKKYYDKLI